MLTLLLSVASDPPPDRLFHSALFERQNGELDAQIAPFRIRRPAAESHNRR
ncbi:MAG: hypothetical protein ACI9IV_000065 [Paracoccaceae bacterium]